VDVLQVDVIRCAGITEFLRIAAVAASHNVPVSTPTAPAQHLHPACSAPGVIVEVFQGRMREEER
jgi:L-alanine-DL-glutamate epimerase-like enolase superfamily enzyme